MAGPTERVYPLTFRPVLKDYPWGGRAIGSRLGRSIPEGPIAESWEISDHPDGVTPIANGPLAGTDLRSLLADWGERLVGHRNAAAIARHRFPLLVKILDARQWLSVQVHPDDDYALEREGDQGKTEMWVVLDAAADAEVLLGLRPGVGRSRLLKAIEDGSTADYLRRLKPRPGDVLFVPPGTLHAIGPGLLLVEIQQASNVTYRLFDWNRRPARPLHVDRALEVIDFAAPAAELVRPTVLGERTEVLADSRHFRVERHRLTGDTRLERRVTHDTFEIWGAIDGHAVVEKESVTVDLAAVSWTLLPADLGWFRLHASKPTTLLRVLTPAQDSSEHLEDRV